MIYERDNVYIIISLVFFLHSYNNNIEYINNIISVQAVRCVCRVGDGRENFSGTAISLFLILFILILYLLSLLFLRRIKLEKPIK